MQVRSAPLPVHAGPNRKQLRRGHLALKNLVDMVNPTQPHPCDCVTLYTAHAIRQLGNSRMIISAKNFKVGPVHHITCLPVIACFLMQVRSAPLPVHAGPNRKQLRRGHLALKNLVDMVGTSLPIYRGIAELCMMKFRDSDKVHVGPQEAAFCSLRSQLLMSLHDIGASELCNQVCF